MIVTLDGPAGAGKSTVARALARRLGFAFLDTGAMYRAVALAGMRRGGHWDKPGWLADLARQATIELADDQVLLDGEDVNEAIRTPEVTAVTRFAADDPRVREHLVGLQRRFAQGRDVITEGRDQGTVAFPDAECKVFLTASVKARAERRLRDFRAQGKDVPRQRVQADIERRDREDTSRPVGPLCRAPDAVEVNTDGLTIDQVVDRLEAIVRIRLSVKEREERNMGEKKMEEKKMKEEVR